MAEERARPGDTIEKCALFMKKQSHNYQKGVRAYSETDYETARRLLLPFAEAGDIEAQTMIGSIYQLGLGGIQISEDEAIKWYLLASEKGNGPASNNLRTMAFLRGDRKEATRYYEKARNQGFRHSPMLKHF
jgi:TPR repeat protein